MPAHYTKATLDDVVSWLAYGIFQIDDKGNVWKGEKLLAQRVNIRNRCEHGDARVDLYHDGKRRSCNVSGVIWMAHTLEPIPQGFEIHHRDEDLTNNAWDNLLAVHSLDHAKLHTSEEIPF